jgi:hypothetical protein
VRNKFYEWLTPLDGFLLGLHFGHEDGGDTLIRNICRLLPNYTHYESDVNLMIISLLMNGNIPEQ